MSIVGKRIGNYVIVGLIGEGGMGAVYRAEHPQIGRKVAVKILDPRMSDHPELCKRFLAEARAIARIEHLNVIDIYDFGRTIDGQLYYVMELLKGVELAEIMDQRGAMMSQEVRPYVEQICEGLQAAHEHKVVHRDLKPENIFILDAKRLVIKIIDFGIAKVYDPGFEGPKKTAKGVVMGTPMTIAPEQAAGHHDKVGPQTDIYSLGVILYWMLAGQPPFDDPTPAVVLAKHITEPPPPLQELNPSVPAEVADLVHHCLAKEPADRPESVAAILRRFNEVTRRLSQPFAIPTGEELVAQVARAPSESEPESGPPAIALAETMPPKKRPFGDARLPAPPGKKPAHLAPNGREADLPVQSQVPTAEMPYTLGAPPEGPSESDISDLLGAMAGAMETEAEPAEAEAEEVSDDGFRPEAPPLRIPFSSTPERTKPGVGSRPLLIPLQRPVEEPVLEPAESPPAEMPPPPVEPEPVADPGGPDQIPDMPEPLADLLHSTATDDTLPPLEEISAEDAFLDTEELPQLDGEPGSSPMMPLELPEEPEPVYAFDGESEEMHVADGPVIMPEEEPALPPLPPSTSKRFFVRMPLLAAGAAVLAAVAGLVIMMMMLSSKPEDEGGGAKTGPVEPVELTVLPGAGMEQRRRRIATALGVAPDAPLEQLEKSAGSDAAARLLVGELTLAAGRPEDAIGHIKVALAANPSDARALFRMGEALQETGRLNAALASFRKVLDADADFDPYTRTRMGQILGLQKQSTLELAEYRAAIGADPDYVPALVLLGYAYARLRRYEEAITELDRAIKLDPRHAMAHYYRGFVVYNLGKVDQAIASFEQALKLNPRHVEAHYYLGQAYVQQGDTAKARAAFKAALKVDPNYEPAILALNKL